MLPMNPHYKIYLEQVCRLVATMSIKSVYAAEKMNSKISMLGGHVNYDDRKTWKYYMNLNGDYHSTDVEMTVTSVDTYEEIPFTKDFLSRHVLTKRTYVYGHKFYDDLIARYPSQETLIKGILNPIPYDQSIPAEDHTILNYQRTLVESNEQYLIPEIQDLILGCHDRWLNIDYSRIEPRYEEAFNTIIYSFMVPWVLTARRRKRFTSEVHSYHQRMYLLSFSGIGVEFDYMSHSQRLWFYRNIRYLNRNLGRQKTFDTLVEKVLNDRTFPLTRYELTLDYENQSRELVPRVMLDKKPEGRIDSIYGSDRDSLKGAILKELPIAKDNPVFIDVSHQDVNDKMINNRFGTMKTKMLESTIIDRSDAEPFTLSSVLLNHWVHMSQIGLYSVKVPFNNPNTGEAYLLDAFDAYIFYVYAVTRYYGDTLVELPCVYINKATREIPPTVEELLEISDPSLKLLPFIDYIFSKSVPLQKVESVITFRDLCKNIHSASSDLREMRHFQNDYKVEGALHAIIDRFYHGRNIELGKGVRYDDWLAERDIFPETLRDIDLLDIANEIYTKVTGVTASAGSTTKDTHAAMLRIMGLLTSYSVQFIASVNENAIKLVDGKYPKLTIPEFNGVSTINTRSETSTIINVGVDGGTNITTPVIIDNVTGVSTDGTVNYPIDARIDAGATTSSMSNVTVGVHVPCFRIDRSGVVDLNTVDHEGVLTIDYVFGSNEDWITDPSRHTDGLPHLSNYNELSIARLNILIGE